MKKTRITFWIATIFIFLFEGMMPIGTLIFAPEYANAGTKPLGYPDYFAIMLIFCKFLGSLAILLPFVPAKLREWAYAGLTFNLVFATLSHAIVDGIPSYVIMPMVVLVVLGLSYFTGNSLRKAHSKEAAGAGLVTSLS